MMTDAPADAPLGPIVFYDRDCAFCRAWLSRVRLRGVAGPAQIVGAQEAANLMPTRLAEIEPSRGIIVVIGDQVHQDVAAMMVLSALTRRKGLFNPAAGWAFGSPARARLFYPAFVSARRIFARAGTAAHRT